MDIDAERLIMDQVRRFGLETPDRMLNKPELELGLDLYYDAFLDLSGERVDTPIQWASIAQYSRFYSFDIEQTDTLFTHIRNMDFAYLKHVFEKK